MLSEAEGRRQARERERDRRKHHKAQLRAKVRALRAALKEARAEKPAHVRRAREQCRLHRRLLVKRAKERRARALADLKLATKQEREAARARCLEGKARAKDSALSEVHQARHALHEERAYQADIRRIEANNRRARLGITKATASERRSESDGEVEGNLPPELVPLWTKVRRRIKGSSRRTRTEAFLEYAEEHPREIVEAQEGGIEARICELEHAHAKAARLAKRPRMSREEIAFLASA
jgi:hypothetical protein